MRFVVPGKPQPKQRPRKGRGRWYTPPETAAYERLVALCATAAGVQPIEGKVQMEIVVCFGDNRRRDVDNCAKALCDGAQGIAYKDDSQVWDLRIRRVEDGDPRAEVEVLPMKE